MELASVFAVGRVSSLLPLVRISEHAPSVIPYNSHAKQNSIMHAYVYAATIDRSVPLPLPVFYNLDDALSMSCLYHETLLSCIVQLLSSTSDLFRANFFFI
jgi:hypothetical protein